MVVTFFNQKLETTWKPGNLEDTDIQSFLYFRISKLGEVS
jgi:hypothetical protein